MHFSFLSTFYHRIIALAGGRHPYAQCDQPIGDNFSFPSTECLVVLFSLILLYHKYRTTIWFKVFVSGTVDGNPQEIWVGVYRVSKFHLNTGGLSKHILYTQWFSYVIWYHVGITHVFSSAEKDRVALSMRKEISLSRLHPTIVSVYAPTMDSPETNILSFYDELRQLFLNISDDDKIILVSDLNARMGGSQTWKCLGSHGWGKANRNGLQLLQFCNKHDLITGNTWFRKKKKTNRKVHGNTHAQGTGIWLIMLLSACVIYKIFTMFELWEAPNVGQTIAW